MELAQILHTEVHKSLNNGIHPNVASIVNGFLKYLKEPRYSSPLTLNELSKLFGNFYSDLNSLITYTFTQSNSTKKKLISQCKYFKLHPKEFDYLLAIANYSSTTVKLTKRDDVEALTQLRVFNFYKFITIFETLEKAQLQLFGSELDGEPPLYDKIFRFEQKDIIFQDFLNKKISLLRNLNLPISCFAEEKSLDQALDKYPVQEMNNLFKQLSSEFTPSGKLRLVVKIQKLLISMLSEVLGDISKVNNDVLLPMLIYFIIYHHPSEETELFLNFTFIHNFLNLLDDIDFSNQPVQSSILGSYIPSDKTKYRNRKFKTIYEVLNFKIDDEEEKIDQAKENEDLKPNQKLFFQTDKELASYIQTNFLNNGELRFFLTNLEAAIFFISNITLVELNSNMKTDHQLLKEPLMKIVETELLSHFKFPSSEVPETTIDEASNTNQNRSRSSSLFNQISNRINDAANSVNRSRSNSSIVKKETFPSIDDSSNPNEGSNNLTPNNDSGNLVRNLIGRLSSASGSLRHIGETLENSTSTSTSTPDDSKKNIESPQHSRTRSSSFDHQQKRNSLSSKITIGMSDFMTRINNSNTNTSSASLLSLDHPQCSGSQSNSHSQPSQQVSTGTESNTTLTTNTSPLRGPEITRSRTTSLQIMDKWFSNLGLSTNSTTAPNNNNNTSNTLQSTKERLETPLSEITQFHNLDFASLTINDLQKMKLYYDQLCSVVISKLDDSGMNSEETSM